MIAASGPVHTAGRGFPHGAAVALGGSVLIGTGVLLLLNAERVKPAYCRLPQL